MSDQTIDNQKKSGSGMWMVISLLALVGLGIISYLWQGTKKEVEACANDKIKLQTDIDGMNQMMTGYVDNMSNDLRSDMTQMLRTYDALIAKDASKADSLNMQKDKINGLIGQLNSAKRLSAQQLFSLRQENKTLRGIMVGYVKQIDSLNTLNIRLNNDLETTTTELTNTKGERDVALEDVKASNEKVKIGSKITAYGFKSVGLREKFNKSMDETTKAKNVVQIKSSFSLGENQLAAAGEKSVYMQITNPDGKTLGSRTVSIDGGSVAYSDKRDITYSNKPVDVSIFYNVEESLIPGNYKVKIYVDGQLSGTDSFTLK